MVLRSYFRGWLKCQHDEMKEGAAACSQAFGDRPFAELHLLRDLRRRLIQDFRAPNHFGVTGLQESNQRPNELPQNCLQLGVVEVARVRWIPAPALSVAEPIRGWAYRRAIAIWQSVKRVLRASTWPSSRCLRIFRLRKKLVAVRNQVGSRSS